MFKPILLSRNSPQGSVSMIVDCEKIQYKTTRSSTDNVILHGQGHHTQRVTNRVAQRLM